MEQLIFDFGANNNIDKFIESDFIINNENISAQKFLQKFFTQKNFLQSQFQSIILKGDQGCGKTHLLNIFANNYQAEFINYRDIEFINPINLFQIEKFYIIDNCSSINSESALFHFINSAFECRAFLVLVIDNQEKFLLKDLNSRLKNIFTLEIKDPSQETVKLLLSNLFSRKQLVISRSVIEEISFMIKKYSQIHMAVKLIESMSHNQSLKKVTNKEIKNFLSRILF